MATDSEYALMAGASYISNRPSWDMGTPWRITSHHDQEQWGQRPI